MPVRAPLPRRLAGRRPTGRAPRALTALLVVLAAAAAPALGAPDPREAGGPLDVVGASLRQAGPQLVLRVRTAGAWSARRLDPVQGRFLCLELDGALRACVAQRDGRTVLLDGDRVLDADVTRPDDRSLEARVPSADLGLGVGRFRWAIVTGWRGRAPCSTQAPCADRAPDAPGGAAGRLVPVRVVGCAARGTSLRTHGPRDHKLVALTFDDGPWVDTSRFLDLLGREKVHATFFLIGRQVPGSAKLVRRMVRDGHMVGNHTWAHHGGGRGRGELPATNHAIQAATGLRPCLFRAPENDLGGGIIGAARAGGMLTVQWDVDTSDYRLPGAGAIAAHVLSHVRPGSIVLMHDGGGPRGQTLAALPSIIAGLRARGYRFATVPELLGLRLRYAG